jgi:hypothetical protein
VKTRLLVVMMALALVCAWESTGAAGDVGYRFRQDTSFGIKAQPGPPSSGVVAADVIIGKPLGLLTTVAGAGVYILTLPMTAGDRGEAAWGLVGRPAGWTFVRPAGRRAPVYEESGVFQPQ